MRILLLLVCLCAFKAQAQVKLLKLEELEQRITFGKDTTFVINFWATWCGPCVAELPYFNQLAVENDNKKVKVLLVSLDFKSKLKSAVIPFVKKMKLNSEVYLLDESNQQQYIDRISKEWSGAIPATIFVNTALNKRLFFEKEFTYNQLISALETFNFKH